MEGAIRVTLPAVSLKIVVSVHFILTIWGDQLKWLPETYLFCNLLVLAVGVWAIASPENEDASQLFLCGMLFTILHDIIVFSIFYTPVPSSHFRFCAGMAILSLILKPLSCLLIFQNHRCRGGAESYSWSGSPYATIEGHTSSKPPPGYGPVPAPGNHPQS
ncbi:type-1 angiotensin II receptor-associated protein-like [Orbicella faveolata]|uniref:type-1 angiotensin II receptor-associated protein-like n=1 Tax=Orbicella faveolata TaxID=48498 RepID=UPI0009E5BE7C|nr:type-1 angiotensin II receptor-associated protein-like [Orbicella faveolata]